VGPEPQMDSFQFEVVCCCVIAVTASDGRSKQPVQTNGPIPRPPQAKPACRPGRPQMIPRPPRIVLRRPGIIPRQRKTIPGSPRTSRRLPQTIHNQALTPQIAPHAQRPAVFAPRPRRPRFLGVALLPDPVPYCHEFRSNSLHPPRRRGQAQEPAKPAKKHLTAQPGRSKIALG
jgi:hypothetical protein